LADRLYKITLLCSLFFQLQTKAQLSNLGLAVYLPMNGNANDSSGNNYHGSIGGATLTADEYGNPNSAFYFGGNAKISIIDPLLLRKPLPELTILVKVKVEAMPEFRQYGLYSECGYNILSWFNQSQLPLLPWERRFQFELNGISGDPQLSGQTPFASDAGFMGIYRKPCELYTNLNESLCEFVKDSNRIMSKWVSIAYVFDHGNISMYFNCERTAGMQSHSNFFQPCPEDSTSPLELSIGYYYPYHPQFPHHRNFVGSIDELRIYTRALGIGEIQNYSGSFCKPEIKPAIGFKKICLGNTNYRISDESETFGIPVQSRLWTIARDNFSLTDSLAFNYQFTNTLNYKVYLKLLDADGFRYYVDTNITVTNTPGIHFLTPEQFTYKLCGDEQSAAIRVSGGLNYQWSPCRWLNRCDSSFVTASPPNEQMYQVKAVDVAGCIDSFNIRVIPSKDQAGVFVPSAFTPNGDGVNDLFGVQSPNIPVGIGMEIFNRWGQKVFETRNPNIQWDGNYRGTPQPPGAYIWNLRYTGTPGCPLNLKKGALVLIR
jgi:gliding motility-associated-like protein